MANDTSVNAPPPIAPGPPPFPNMVWIPGGTFLMGSDKHYPEERPAHRVTVDGFWIDQVPVTNERFGTFVEQTRHVTFAEIPAEGRGLSGRVAGQAVCRVVGVRQAGRTRRYEGHHALVALDAGR